MRIQTAGFLWLAIAWCVCPAQSAKQYAGTWVLPIQGKNLMVLRLEAGSGDTVLTGSLARPVHFNTSGDYVSEISAGSVTERIVSSSWRNGGLVFTVEKPNDPSDKDTFVMSLTPDAQAAVRPDDLSASPMLFARSNQTAALATDWDSARSYALDDDGVSNPEMTHIFEADQKAREGDMAKVNWSVVGRQDEQRRVAVLSC
jgi:hypothetical protein